MNPIEWLATLLWDPSGKRRYALRLRLARTRRQVSRYERINQRAVEQIRRVQKISSDLSEME